ncbi:MAG: LemA family protein [Saprospiraceae bacterium]|nr:LemA family protein [Saprospiraceae bacterium]
MNDDKIIGRYVEKMITIQRAREEEPLTEEELKEIAFSVGMSEADWQASQEVLLRHLQTGSAHLKAMNWKDAQKEFDQAVALSPYNEDALYGLAKVHYELYKQTGEDKHSDLSAEYAGRALVNKNTKLDTASIKLLKNLRQAATQQTMKQKSRKRSMLVLGSLIVIVLLGSYFMLSSTVNAVAEKVEAQWAQVDNVYQRRADLIPKMEAILNAAGSNQKQQLEKIKALTKELEGLKDNKQAYFKKQQEIGQIMNKLTANLGATSELSGEKLQMLMVQVEGSANRIAQERRKYNEAVQKYNNKIGKFPYTVLGYSKKEYFENNAVQN